MKQNPIPLDLARRVWRDYYEGPTKGAVSGMQAALAAHLPFAARRPSCKRA